MQASSVLLPGRLWSTALLPHHPTGRGHHSSPAGPTRPFGKRGRLLACGMTGGPDSQGQAVLS